MSNGSRGAVLAIVALAAVLALSAPASATPLHDAVRAIDVRTVARLLAAGADPNAFDSSFGKYLPWTYLGWGVQDRRELTEDHLEIIRLLLKAGADPNSDSPLKKFSGAGNADAIRLLLDAGADPDTPGTLHSALERPNNAEVVRLLLEAGADPHQFTPMGTPLSNLVNHYNGSQLIPLEENIRLLFDAFAPNQRLFEAIGIDESRHGSKWVRYALDTGADPNARTANEWTLLGVAVWKDAYEDDPTTVRLLLDAGADPATVLGGVDNIGEETVLHVAARGCSPDIVELLLKAGLDPNVMVGERHTPLHAAILHGLWREALDGDITSKWYDERLRRDCPRTVRMLIDAGANPEATNEFGATVLHVAASLGQVEMVRLLLEADANANALGTHSISRNETPLDQAEKERRFLERSGESTSDHDEVIRLLRRAMKREVPEPKQGVVRSEKEIREIQTALTALGYDPGPIDGKIGPKTTSAFTEWLNSIVLTKPRKIMTVIQIRRLKHEYNKITSQ